MGEAQRRVAIERALDLLEDPALRAEDVERLVPAVALSSTGDINAAALAVQRRIAAWQPPGALGHTPEERAAAYRAYVRLGRLAATLSTVMCKAVERLEEEAPR